MFPQKEPPKYERMIETELEHTLVMLNGVAPDSKGYSDTLTSVERLHTLLGAKSKQSVSKETWVTVGANLAGILLIINHEYAHPITSKALGFVTRLK